MSKTRHEVEYRYHDGAIQTRWNDGEKWNPWIKSAHDVAEAKEIAEYEAEGHPATAALKEKYGVRA